MLSVSSMPNTVSLLSRELRSLSLGSIDTSHASEYASSSSTSTEAATSTATGTISHSALVGTTSSTEPATLASTGMTISSALVGTTSSTEPATSARYNAFTSHASVFISTTIGRSDDTSPSGPTSTTRHHKPSTTHTTSDSRIQESARFSTMSKITASLSSHDFNIMIKSHSTQSSNGATTTPIIGSNTPVPSLDTNVEYSDRTRATTTLGTSFATVLQASANNNVVNIFGTSLYFILYSILM
ncbi:hypothetical protein KAFR_0G02720 [Kazachstania africana CBS 2517]|uniref:Uncharacterized protein n=1 Tax=Kazachstania africana (strain ATCC 22294 / BCRC 22015 / CBS 2517 / CECT 1963 / NBRC 1671 / NRRL Y-8276) TaxID=1071382 RepID=H2AY53_KAZAF|nr:hypothetical protein KAFR_0G02720 [Kazachstania africana CBS 2517]CCF59303.1 hypothetical protein KAFR_0G02720 [Kazachstania africana CBS 2517]